MIKFALFYCISFSIQVYGQVDEALSEKRANYQINEFYKAGSFLIYDCYRGYYTCVDEDGFNKCRDKRLEDTKLKLKDYSCAPLKKLPTNKECAYKNYEVIEANAKKRFCYPKN